MTYLKLKSQLTAVFRVAVLNNDFEEFLDKCKPFVTTFSQNENDLKNSIELIVREVLLELITEQTDVLLLERVFQFSIDTVLNDLAQGNLPVLVLGDMFESSTIAECETIFAFVESRVEIFKKDTFFKLCKNHLLRSCNDLLRRLSRSQNTVFCGRILLFLAHIFPLSERSGLNIISEFNLDNTTTFSEEDLIVDASSENTDENEEGEIPNPSHSLVAADKKLYHKFWSLQGYFRSPNTCYDKTRWRLFTNCTSDILTVFGSFNSDDATSTKYKETEFPQPKGLAAYFAKYLTSPELFELELSDSKFRRYLMVQFLILFQYLSSPVKFKAEAFLLSDDQQVWMKEATKKIYKLLEQTPPDGAAFGQHIKKILEREEYWNAWKNEGCPDFRHVEEKTCLERPRKRTCDEASMSEGKIEVGSSELTKLWNICPDNWEACRSPKRNFVPSLDSFFGGGASKMKSDGKFAWKALRLLSMKSPDFFTVSAKPFTNVPEYLAGVLQRMTKSHNIHQHQQETPTSTGAEDSVDEGNDELLPTYEDDPGKEEMAST